MFTYGSDKVGLVTKNFYLGEMKIVSDKNFFQDRPKGQRGRKYPKKGHFWGFFIIFYKKSNVSVSVCPTPERRE